MIVVFYFLSLLVSAPLAQYSSSRRGQIFKCSTESCREVSVPGEQLLISKCFIDSLAFVIWWILFQGIYKTDTEASIFILTGLLANWLNEVKLFYLFPQQFLLFLKILGLNKWQNDLLRWRLYSILLEIGYISITYAKLWDTAVQSWLGNVVIVIRSDREIFY